MASNPALNKQSLNDGQQIIYDEMAAAPITVLQIGEGNFLRGFFDWMIHESRKQGFYSGSIAVTQPRPGGKPKIEALASQDGLYTLVIRGLENGVSVERKEVISVFREVFDPYSDWSAFLELAGNPELKIVVSNTTEAGLVYRPEALVEDQPIQSFPGKLTLFLYERYNAFNGDPTKGLLCLPCELLERNGDMLLECVERYSADWGLPDTFLQWVREHNRFLNSLVDRIVTGYPDEIQAQSWFQEWGYDDPMLTTAEPYHLWAIEGEPELEELLPLAKSGLNVHWVEDLKPYQQRKVRILNGAHTFMTPLGILAGLQHVRETVEHPVLGKLIRDVVQEEIIPSMGMDEEVLRGYASDVFERFLNPFIQHRLSDIAMNSLSKFKTRLLPSVQHYLEEKCEVPSGLALGLAGLLRYYRVKQTDEGYEGRTLNGAAYLVRDDAALLAAIEKIWRAGDEQGLSVEATIAKLLELEELWGFNLAEASSSLATAVSAKFEEMERFADE